LFREAKNNAGCSRAFAAGKEKKEVLPKFFLQKPQRKTSYGKTTSQKLNTKTA